jgi:hypothetical protein
LSLSTFLTRSSKSLAAFLIGAYSIAFSSIIFCPSHVLDPRSELWLINRIAVSRLELPFAVLSVMGMGVFS